MKKVIFIAGPTAVGKSAVAVELAKKLDGEIISADSVQVYKHMSIGSAKITPEEAGGVAHHLIDHIYPDDVYNVAIFKDKAAALIDDITNRGKMPIICGGTGFYINALLYGAEFKEDTTCPEERLRLEELALSKGSEHLHSLLLTMDEEAAVQIGKNNTKRLIRALEFYKATGGQKISLHNRQQKEVKTPAYDGAVYILNKDRVNLYDKINQRVDEMVAKGLVGEVSALLAMGYSPALVSMQALGYKEIIAHLEGICTLDEAVEAIKQGTRRFAKRQVTWFKHQLPGAVWVDVDDYEDLHAVAGFVLSNLHFSL
ncbi:MAG: tRNA (adenosine(37)-N6)-dimethylallyltransferase MiaA [Defluviitaleaceae bacterium]|nr:tRNA (adenosine(37)-N6)-dimethylallyltransferase MiaA [Defluviitaleaceae bacterium]